VTAYELLERGLVSVIASDAHSSKQRTPIMMDTYEDLLGGFDADYLDVLFEENPRRILNDEPVLRDF
jgi:tyrosine-protein phosphatase YwqE